MKFLFGIIISIATLAGIVLILGYISPVEYEGEIREFFPERRHIIWEGLADVNRIPKVKRDVKSVFITSNDRGLVVWTENLKKGGSRSYRTVEKRDPYRYTINLFSSSFGVTGTWTHVLQSTEKGTVVQVLEKSETKNIWMRGINKIRGRDIYLKNVVKEIRVLLFRNLIDTP